MNSCLSFIDFHNTWDIIKLTAFLHIFWGTLFYLSIKFIHFKGLDFKTSISIKQKFVALLHDVLVIAIPLYSYTIKGMRFHSEAEPEIFLTYLSGAAYFTAHLVVISYFKITTSAQVVHHIMTVVAIYAVSGFVPEIVNISNFYLFALQLSHVPLHGRSLLREFGLRYTIAYEFFEMMYFLVYTFERLVLGLWVYFYSWIYMNPGAVVLTVIGGINLQSLYFIYQMIFLTHKKYLKYKERSKRGIDYWLLQTNPEVEKLSYYKKEEKEKIF